MHPSGSWEKIHLGLVQAEIMEVVMRSEYFGSPRVSLGDENSTMGDLVGFLRKARLRDETR